MGCVSSKDEKATVKPALHSLDSDGVARFEGSGEFWDGPKLGSYMFGDSEEEVDECGRIDTSSLCSTLGNLHRYIAGEQVAAGWPSWLVDVAGEMTHGWVPLKAHSFLKLEKIGQGTYSSVYRGQEVETGKIVALKKVHLDNLEPESVKFMAREIQILHRLNHPNIIKLEGIITSQVSFSVYLVFEYMEHDLAGLSSRHDIHFSESQIKCYMQQLLSGLEHCHSHQIIHRDIKCANLLVNNEGILKLADFGLANLLSRRTKKPLTTRVVTLWYRPPELLLGSTDYDASVDLWSVGCVFAELFVRKPILKGRNEVEQIHKIYKLCGFPPEDYWERSKLPHATAFRPRQPYKNSLQENFNFLPETALDLLKTFLSFEPHKRGTASAALGSQYFKTKPYACESSSLPKYPPTKEIDIDTKYKIDALRVGANAKSRQSSGYTVSKPDTLTKTSSNQEGSKISHESKKYSLKQVMPGISHSTRLHFDLQPDPTTCSFAEDRNSMIVSQKDPIPSSLTISISHGFPWAKEPKASSTYRRGHSVQFEPDKSSQVKHIFMFDRRENTNADTLASDSQFHNHCQTAKQAMVQQLNQLEHSDFVHSLGGFPSRDLSEPYLRRDAILLKQKSTGHRDQREKVEISRHLPFKSSKVDGVLKKDGRQRIVTTQSLLFYKGRKEKSRNTVHFGN